MNHILTPSYGCCSLVTKSCLTLWPHGLQHTRPPCPSLSPGICSYSCPLSRWCHPTISSLVAPFSSCLQSFPTSGSFPISQLFASNAQSIGDLASFYLSLSPVQSYKLLSIFLQAFCLLDLIPWIYCHLHCIFTKDFI